MWVTWSKEIGYRPKTLQQVNRGANIGTQVCPLSRPMVFPWNSNSYRPTLLIIFSSQMSIKLCHGYWLNVLVNIICVWNISDSHWPWLMISYNWKFKSGAGPRTTWTAAHQGPVFLPSLCFAILSPGLILGWFPSFTLGTFWCNMPYAPLFKSRTDRKPLSKHRAQPQSVWAKWSHVPLRQSLGNCQILIGLDKTKPFSGTEGQRINFQNRVLSGRDRR